MSFRLIRSFGERQEGVRASIPASNPRLASLDVLKRPRESGWEWGKRCRETFPLTPFSPRRFLRNRTAKSKARAIFAALRPSGGHKVVQALNRPFFDVGVD